MENLLWNFQQQSLWLSLFINYDVAIVVSRQMIQTPFQICAIQKSYEKEKKNMSSVLHTKKMARIAFFATEKKKIEKYQTKTNTRNNSGFVMIKC